MGNIYDEVQIEVVLHGRSGYYALLVFGKYNFSSCFLFSNSYCNQTLVLYWSLFVICIARMFLAELVSVVMSGTSHIKHNRRACSFTLFIILCLVFFQTRHCLFFFCQWITSEFYYILDEYRLFTKRVGKLWGRRSKIFLLKSWRMFLVHLSLTTVYDFIKPMYMCAYGFVVKWL